MTYMVERLALPFYMGEWVLRVLAGQLRTHLWWMLPDAVLILIGAVALIPNLLCVSEDV